MSSSALRAHNWIWVYRPAQLAIDLSILAGAFVGAYLLRFDFALTQDEAQSLVAQLPFVILVQLLALALSGARKRSWRYTNLGDVPTFLGAAFYATSVLLLVRLSGIRTLAPLHVPLSITIIDAGLGFGGILAVRLLRRCLDEWADQRRGHGNANRLPVVLAGAGRAGVLAARELRAWPAADIDPVAFVDDDPLKQGTVIAGLRVEGSTTDLPEVLRKHECSQVVLTISSVTPERKRRIVGQAQRAGARVREIPGFYDILQGKVSITRLRDVRPEQLLGRDPVRLDESELRHWLAGKRVLISGAGGSIGSELARQAIANGAAAVGLLERSEYALFRIEEELRGTLGTVVTPILADICDRARIEQILQGHRPDLIVHAAAHKHVPMMELHACEAVTNNVCGTQVIATAAGQFGVPRFVMVSTDKAVNPTSIMGASKRVAELVIQDLDQQFATRYCAVRFGNVLGSAGSVIPLFQRQIRRGGPVTVTDAEMRRYFMSIPEAAQLVLQALTMAKGAEIFVLDMGEPVLILKLAENLIRLSGYEPYEEIPIEITGRRPGEKLFEELGNLSENLDCTRHHKIFIGRLQPYPAEQLHQQLRQLQDLAVDGDTDGIRHLLSVLLPEARLEPPLRVASARLE